MLRILVAGVAMALGAASLHAQETMCWDFEALPGERQSLVPNPLALHPDSSAVMRGENVVHRWFQDGDSIVARTVQFWPWMYRIVFEAEGDRVPARMDHRSDIGNRPPVFMTAFRIDCASVDWGDPPPPSAEAEYLDWLGEGYVRRLTANWINPRDLAEFRRSIREHYPDELRAECIGGSAMVQVLLDASGQVVSVVLDQTSGNELLDRAALAAAEEFEFQPAVTDEGVAVPTWWVQEVPFIRSTIGCTPELGR